MRFNFPLTKIAVIKKTDGISLVVQCLRLRASTAGGGGSIPGGELRSHMQNGVAKKKKKRRIIGEFPGSSVVRAPRFHCRGPGFDPLSGN